jgi:hypothetical protein
MDLVDLRVLIITVIAAMAVVAMTTTTMMTVIITENTKGEKESTVVGAVHQAVSRNYFKKKF